MTLLRPALLVALFVVSVCAAAAQEARKRPESERLAVEVGGTDHRFRVSDGDGYAQFNAPRQRAGWERPKGQPPLTSVRLRASYEGDAVRLRVAAVFDDSYPADAPGPKYGEREEEVASVLAREGETVTLKEFRRLGTEPLVLKVVRAEPEPEMQPAPASAPPGAVSRIKSVDVVSFVAGGAQPERGTLTLVNVSTKVIVALVVGAPDRGYTHTAQAAPGRALLQPGGTYQTEVSLGGGGYRTPNGYLPEPPPEAVVVMSAVFDDGSYEGDTEGAARMVARQKGRLAQLARVLALVQGVLEAQPDVAALRTQIAGLRIDVEPALLEALRSQFPTLSGDEGRSLLAAAALEGLRGGREEALRAIDDAAGPDPRRQLDSVRTRLEKSVGPRRD